MTKTLTEQWQEGKLKEGYYYTLLDTDSKMVEINYCWDDGCFQDYCDNMIDEVLAPVPSYDEVKEMSQKIERLELDNEAFEMAYNEGKEINAELLSKTEQLQKKLEIATKALKEMVGEPPTNFSDCETYMWAALQALKEMEGVK